MLQTFVNIVTISNILRFTLPLIEILLPPMQTEIEVGRIIKLLFDNHSKNKYTSASALKLPLKELERNTILHSVNTQLTRYNMTLVGINDDAIDSYTKCTKYFILRETCSKLNTDTFQKLVLVLSVVFLEAESLTESRLSELVGDSLSASEIGSFASMGYLKYEKVKEDQRKVGFGWRYHVEFKGFDPQVIYKGVEMEALEGKYDESIKRIKTTIE